MLLYRCQQCPPDMLCSDWVRCLYKFISKKCFSNPLAVAENDKLSITDLNSTNGTYIDDQELVPMRAMEVSIGAEVTFGQYAELDACTQHLTRWPTNLSLMCTHLQGVAFAL